MTTATFDSLQFAKNLGAGGFFNKEQAETLAKTLGNELARQREEEARQREADKAREEERDKELVTKGDLTLILETAFSKHEVKQLKWGFGLLAGYFVATTATNTGLMFALLQLMLPLAK